MTHTRPRTPSTGLLRRFRRAEGGSVLPLIGLLSVMLIGCIGIAIDIGRAVVVRARLVDALDSAGLAVASRISTVDATAEAEKFVAANFAANFAGATVSDVLATPNQDKTVITVSATATMPTSFMKLFGNDSVKVTATSEVTRKLTGLEVVMVLDNTGSMQWPTDYMPSLKSAANLLVDQLFGDQTTAKNLYVGLVPFSQAVNIGTSASRTLWVNPTTLLPVNRPHYPGLWTGCVEARRNGLDQTDDPPLTADLNSLFTAYYSPDSSNLPYPYNDDNDWIRPDGGARSVYYTDYDTQRGPGSYCPSAVTPMTNVKSKITAGIGAMKAAGSTMINLGAVWGWRMLSPRWRGYWDGDMAANALPLDYGTKNMEKAVVLMTDGANSFSNYNYTAYDMLSAKRLGTNVQSNAEDELDKRLGAVCTKMKTAGVTVYTVAFNVTDTGIKSLLESCATSTSNYFDAGDQEKLKTAFKTIGDSLSNLRVSR